MLRGARLPTDAELRATLENVVPGGDIEIRGRSSDRKAATIVLPADMNEAQLGEFLRDLRVAMMAKTNP